VLGGQAFIDQDGLDLATHESARDFIVSYGFDMDSPHQRLQVARTFRDARRFLENDILDGTGLKIPPAVAKPGDPLNLLVWASRKPMDEVALWSCAMLRVMHTLLYINSSIYLRFLPEIQRQVFGRYRRHLSQREGGGWLLGGDFDVPLVDVDFKESKNKSSMLLKLLQKPENVAETIYDHMGVRMVAEDMLGVLQALRFLIEHNVFQAAHIKPSRTRNLMVDIPALEEWMAGLPEGFSVDSLTPAERLAVSERLAQRVGRPAVNPHSSSDYSALQFTVSTLVRLPGLGAPDGSGAPGTAPDGPDVGAGSTTGARLGAAGARYDAVDAAGAGVGVEGVLADAGVQGTGILGLIPGQDEFTFFFAHEVQLMERAGFENSRMGPASHLEYKHRQREAVRRRVLRGILPQEM
jgi:uncharacterized protein (TIGR04562 family)